MLLFFWTFWPTMAQEFPKKSLNHEGLSSVTPVARQEANIEAKVMNLRKKNHSIDASSFKETNHSQELDSTTWPRFLFPLFSSTKHRNRTPITRKKKQSSKKNMKRRKFTINKNRVSSGKKKHTMKNRGRKRTTSGRTGRSGYMRQKMKPPTKPPSYIESPVASPDASPTTSTKMMLSPDASPAASPIISPTS